METTLQWKTTMKDHNLNCHDEWIICYSFPDYHYVNILRIKYIVF